MERFNQPICLLLLFFLLLVPASVIGQGTSDAAKNGIIEVTCPDKISATDELTGEISTANDITLFSYEVRLNKHDALFDALFGEQKNKIYELTLHCVGFYGRGDGTGEEKKVAVEFAKVHFFSSMQVAGNKNLKRLHFDQAKYPTCFKSKVTEKEVMSGDVWEEVKIKGGRSRGYKEIIECPELRKLTVTLNPDSKEVGEEEYSKEDDYEETLEEAAIRGKAGEQHGSKGGSGNTVVSVAALVVGVLTLLLVATLAYMLHKTKRKLLMSVSEGKNVSMKSFI